MRGAVADLRGWRTLLTDFLEGRTDGPAFETAFLDRSRAAVDAGERVPFAIDRLFYEVDAYCADPALFQPGDNDETALRAHAEEALARFDEPWPPTAPLSAEDRRNRALLEKFRDAADDLGLLRK